MAPGLPFSKATALGNDFLILEETAGILPDLSCLAQKMCNRHFGLGADGLLVVSREGVAREACVRTLNSDGSEAELSGNGLRCVAAWLVDQGCAGPIVRLDTRAGTRLYTLLGRSAKRFTFESAMGAPVLEPEKVPFRPESAARVPLVDYPLEVEHRAWPATILSLGNPQCVIFLDDFEQMDWRALGRRIERHPGFPERTNVAFVRALARDRIEARFWERGAGETLSSGTGACAAAVAAILRGLTGRELCVDTSGGEMRVRWPEGDEVYLTGTAEIVARGEFFSEI